MQERVIGGTVSSIKSLVVDEKQMRLVGNFSMVGTGL